MADFSTILPALASLCTSLTGLQASERDMPQKMTRPSVKGKLIYLVTNVTSVGLDDDIRYVYDAGTNTLHMVVAGIRTFTFSVRFEGEDHSPGRDALFYLERLRTRLVWPAAQAAMFTANVALTKRMAFQDLSRVLSAEDRVQSVGVLDLIFQAVVEDSPTTGSSDFPVSWVERVHFNSDTLDNEGGTPLPVQIHGVVDRP